MASPTYKDFMVGNSPMPQRNGAAWAKGVGDVLDDRVLEVKSGVKLRFPLLASDDALAQIGLERGMPKLPSESSATYAARLKGAWDVWPWAGTPFGLLSVLGQLGYTNVALVQFRGSGTAGRMFRLNWGTNFLPGGDSSGDGRLLVTSLPSGCWGMDFSVAWARWRPSTAYVLTDSSTGLPTFIAPTWVSGNGHRYKLTTAGTSGSQEPSWPLTAGATIADGTCIWTEAGDARFWSKFELVFFPPLPVGWVGNPGSVSHVGAGAGTVTVTTPASGSVYQAVIKVTQAGSPGSGLQVKVSQKNGIGPGGSIYTVPANGLLGISSGELGDASTGIDVAHPVVVTFAGSFNLNDTYSFSNVQTVPASSTDEVARIRSAIKKWQPGHATCNQITVLTQGELFGFRWGTIGDPDGSWSLGAGNPWCVGGNANVIITP